MCRNHLFSTYGSNLTVSFSVTKYRKAIAACFLFSILIVVTAEAEAQIYGNKRMTYRSLLKRQGYTNGQLNSMSTSEMAAALANNTPANTSHYQTPSGQFSSESSDAKCRAISFLGSTLENEYSEAAYRKCMIDGL